MEKPDATAHPYTKRKPELLILLPQSAKSQEANNNGRLIPLAEHIPMACQNGPTVPLPVPQGSGILESQWFQAPGHL